MGTYIGVFVDLMCTSHMVIITNTLSGHYQVKVCAASIIHINFMCLRRCPIPQYVIKFIIYFRGRFIFHRINHYFIISTIIKVYAPMTPTCCRFLIISSVEVKLTSITLTFTKTLISMKQVTIRADRRHARQWASSMYRR